MGGEQLTTYFSGRGYLSSWILEWLDSGGPLSDVAFLKDFGGMPLLQKLDLSRNPICSLPESIKGLNMLQLLRLESCTRLQSLPELPSSLKDLNTHNFSSLQRMSNLPNLLDSLYAKLYNCEELVEIRGLFKLEPIRNFDMHMVNNLGLFDLDVLQGVEIVLWNNLAKIAKKGPIQGLDEFNIFSTFLPGVMFLAAIALRIQGTPYLLL